MVFYYKSFLSFDLGFIKIQAWGILVAIAFLAGLWLALKEADRKKQDKEIIYGIVTIMLFSMFIGARLLYVIQEWGYYSANLLEIFKIWDGGLSFFGGFIVAIVWGFFYLRSKKVHVLGYLDTIAPSVAIGHAIGRIGCIFGDGGHLGKLTTAQWGASILNTESEFYGQVRHLTSLYEFVELTLIFVILYSLRKKRYFEGFLFSTYAFMYSFSRFFTDFYRTDPTYLGLTIAQYISITLFLIFGIFIIMNLKNLKKVKR